VGRLDSGLGSAADLDEGTGIDDLIASFVVPAFLVGDITTTAELVRVVIMGQIVLGIVVVGLGCRDRCRGGESAASNASRGETGEPPRNE
jgi:hypothetical protein